MYFHQVINKIVIKTCGEGFTNITPQINDFIKESCIKTGIINLSILHTSCSLTINENADPRVLEDLSAYIKAIVPYEAFMGLNEKKTLTNYSHCDEGIDDMPAHIKTALTNTSISLTISDSKLLLGTWQAVYLWEHRQFQHARNICLHIIGERSNT